LVVDLVVETILVLLDMVVADQVAEELLPLQLLLLKEILVLLAEAQALTLAVAVAVQVTMALQQLDLLQTG
jgi:hypothetical protein